MAQAMKDIELSLDAFTVDNMKLFVAGQGLLAAPEATVVRLLTITTPVRSS
jgi:hypothetical protein